MSKTVEHFDRWIGGGWVSLFLWSKRRLEDKEDEEAENRWVGVDEKKGRRVVNKEETKEEDWET